MNIRSEQTFRILSIAGIVLPPLFLLVCMWRFGHDLPVMDEWDFLFPVVQKHYETGVSLSDYLVQHNEHWLVFPMFVMAPLAFLTGWDLRAELACTFLLAIALFVLIARALVMAFREANVTPKFWLLPLWSLLFFSVSQWQTWLWPMHMLMMFSLCFAYGAIIVLSRSAPSVVTCIVAALLAGVASFSHGACLAVWPAGATVLALRSSTRREAAVLLGVWFGIAAAIGAIYVGTQHETDSFNRIPSATNYAGSIVRYILVWLGGPMFTTKLSSAALGGCLGLVGAVRLCAALITSPNRKGRLSLLPGLMVFSCSAATIIALGRFYDAPDQALSSRYITFATPFWLALSAMVSLYWPQPATATEAPPLKKAAIGFVLAVFALGIAANLRGAYISDERYDGFWKAREEFISGGNSDALNALHPNRAQLLEAREFMREHRLSVFRYTSP